MKKFILTLLFAVTLTASIFAAPKSKALPKCKKETQHGNYNLCRNGCPQGALNHVKSNRKKSGESSKNLTQNRSLMRAEKWDWI